MWEYLIQHWTNHGVAPDEAVVRHAYPTMTWDDYSQPLQYFIGQLQTRRKRAIILESLNASAELFDQADDDPEYVNKIQVELTDALSRASIETSGSLVTDVTSDESLRSYRTLLDDRLENPGFLRGITTGFNGIDYVTGGLQHEHLVVLFGLPKSFKSATLLAMADAVHSANEPALFIGFEMSHEEQMDRLMSMRARVSLNRILNGTLSGRDEKAIALAQEALRTSRPFTFATDISATSTVTEVAAQIREVNPRVVFIDGVYMMRSSIKDEEPGSERALRDISRSLKRLAQSTKTTIVITSQASQNRVKNGKLTLASGMYSQAFGQDANIVLGTQRVEGEDGDEGPAQVIFSVLASRSGPRKETHLEWDWDKGLVTELDPDEMREKLDRSKYPSPGTEDNQW